MDVPEPVSDVKVHITGYDVDESLSHVTVSEDADVPGFVNYDAGDTIPFIDIHFRGGEWKVLAEAGNTFGRKNSLISVSDISEWHYEDDMTIAQRKIAEVDEIL